MTSVPRQHQSASLTVSIIKPQLNAVRLRDLILLSKKLGCLSIEKELIARGDAVVETMGGFQTFELATTCDVGRWLVLALIKICGRKLPLSAEEGRKLGHDMLAVVSRIREERSDPTIRRRLVRTATGEALEWSLERSLYASAADLGVPLDHFREAAGGQWWAARYNMPENEVRRRLGSMIIVD